MIKNYIKLALRGLGRRKFLTFISLFGISFTLGILMVVLSFLQSELGSNAPLTHKDDLVYVSHLRLKKVYYDTITTVDTVMDNGMMVLDTTFDIKSKGSGESNSSINADMALKMLSDLPSADNMAIFDAGSISDVFINGVKLPISIMYANAAYWDLFEHPMLEGRSFDETDVENKNLVIVISTKLSEDYFGRPNGVVGEEMVIDQKTYKVIGLYEHKGKVIEFVSPDAVTPYTNGNLEDQFNIYFGGYNAMIKKKSNVSDDQIKSEIKAQAKLVPLDHPDNKYGYEKAEFEPETYNEMFANGVYYDRDSAKSLKIMTYVLGGLLLFFILLPTLNLINLNVSRIMDRSSEIGVRKAFGAHNGNIIFQFIIENIVQTFIGGLLGLGLAFFLINLLNNIGYMNDARLEMNYKFFIYSFIATLIFGILSGLLPALRMSRLHIVNALKNAKI